MEPVKTILKKPIRKTTAQGQATGVSPAPPAAAVVETNVTHPPSQWDDVPPADDPDAQFEAGIRDISEGASQIVRGVTRLIIRWVRFGRGKKVKTATTMWNNAGGSSASNDAAFK